MGLSKKGLAFEKWVAELYDELGMLWVKHNVIIKHKKNGIVAKSQFDITYRDPIRKYYVECKYHETGAVVSFQDVATFAAKLSLVNTKEKFGVMVTNTDYDKRTRLYARKTGLRLIDGKRLFEMHRKRLGMFERLRRDGKTLDGVITSYFR